MRFIKAAIFILLIPSILIMMGRFQDYADANLTLTTLQDTVFRLFPFAFITLCILGLFMAFKPKGGGEE